LIIISAFDLVLIHLMFMVTGKSKKFVLCGCQVYPLPIPDLFCGNPLVVSGRFHGKFPRSIKVVGMLPDQTVWDIEVLSSESPGVPLSKVFAKQQLDLLTAQAWLYDDKHMQEQVSS
jgi:hypothetical protein